MKKWDSVFSFILGILTYKNNYKKIQTQVSAILTLFLTCLISFIIYVGESLALCNIMRELLNLGAYVGFVQSTLVQAQVTFLTFKEDLMSNKI